MNLLEFLDRVGQRRIERLKLVPHRPRDTRMLVGALFFLGYYVLVFTMIKVVVPAENGPLVRDALLVLGPVVGAIGAALFRTDVKDEIAATNTGAAFAAVGEQAKATTAAAMGTPPTTDSAVAGAQDVADAAQSKADEIEQKVAP